MKTKPWSEQIAVVTGGNMARVRLANREGVIGQFAQQVGVEEERRCKNHA
jgi:hypothetical protein